MRPYFYSIVAALFIALSVLPSATYAQFSAGMGAHIQSFDYEEFDLNGHTLNHEKGDLPGLSIFLAYSRHGFTQTLSGEVYHSTIDYRGQTQLGMPHTTQTQTRLYHVAYRLAYPIYQEQLFIHGQANWDYWSRSIKSTALVLGLDEIYSWPSIDLGLNYIVAQTHSHSIALDASYSKVLSGNFEVNLSALGAGTQTLDLGSGKGFQSSLLYQYTLDKQTKAGIKLIYKQWDFARSRSQHITTPNSVFSFTEPRSDSKRLGLALTLSLLF